MGSTKKITKNEHFKQSYKFVTVKNENKKLTGDIEFVATYDSVSAILVHNCFFFRFSVSLQQY